MRRLRELAVPERTVEVRIDKGKCDGPIKCGKCLKNCPAAVFITFPKAREKGKVCEDWEIVADDTFCWGCEVCIKVCPKNAITLVYLERKEQF